MKLETDIRNTLVDAIAGAFAGGKLKLYVGAAPADPNDPPAGALLCTIDLPNPAFGAGAAGVASKSGVWSAVASGTGLAGVGRIENAAADKWMYFTVGIAAEELVLDDANIVTGNNVLINTFTITQPAT